jgi:hypothetical protein
MIVTGIDILIESDYLGTKSEAVKYSVGGDW